MHVPRLEFYIAHSPSPCPCPRRCPCPSQALLALGAWQAGTSTGWRDTYYASMLAEVVAHVRARTPLVAANIWAWGGEARPRRPRGPYEELAAEHVWQKGDALLGDPPHEAAGWYSIYDVDNSTLAVIANLSATLADAVAALP